MAQNKTSSEALDEVNKLLNELGAGSKTPSEEFDGKTAKSHDSSDSGKKHFGEKYSSEITEIIDIPKENPTDSNDESNDDSEDDGKEKNLKPLPLRILLRIVKIIWNSGFIVKAGTYIAVVLILATFCSYFIISIGNDVFAFVKTDNEVTLEISDDMTRKEVAYLLEKNDVIKYSWAFELYMIYKGEDTFLPGEHTVSSSMNYNQIIYELTEEPYVLVEVSVTIPEGYTTDQMIDLFVANGIGTREGFVEAINNYPYKHEFVKELEEIGYSENRKYRLEGYLYPDTYYFYTETPEYLIINKLLNNFDEKVWQYYKSVFKEAIDAEGLTFDDIITIASLVQMEAKKYIDFEPISYVFHNRLAHPEAFPYLESCATVQYFLEERVLDLTYEHTSIDNPYNTYLYKGLPPGAICNPGYDAISAAIYPDAPLDENGEVINAYFFVANRVGTTYYSATLAGHNKNKELVKSQNEVYDSASGDDTDDEDE